MFLWCRSLSHRYFCIVAVQHSHSGKIGLRKFFIEFKDKSLLKSNDDAKGHSQGGRMTPLPDGGNISLKLPHIFKLSAPVGRCFLWSKQFILSDVTKEMELWKKGDVSTRRRYEGGSTRRGELLPPSLLHLYPTTKVIYFTHPPSPVLVSRTCLLSM